MAQETTATRSIKLVVLDIDGTLLNSEHELSDRNKKALKAAADDGVKIALATGRTQVSAQYVIDQLGIKVSGIWLQGLAIMDEAGETRYLQTLDPVRVREIITFVEDRGFPVVGFSGNRALIRAEHEAVKTVLETYHEPTPESVGPLHNLLASVPMNKLMIVGQPRQLTALRWQLNAQHDGAIRLLQAGVPEMLEVMPPGMSKGVALQTLMRDLEIDPDAVLVMGDAENDVEMIEAAGLGVAVGNATEHVKSVAQHVVGTNDEDGVAQAIEQFVIKRKLDEPVAEPAAAEEKKAAEPVAETSDEKTGEA